MAPRACRASLAITSNLPGSGSHFHTGLPPVAASAPASSVKYPLSGLASVSVEHDALYQESLRNPERFWGDLARRRLRWSKEFDQVMDCDMEKGEFKWFGGGVINVSGA